VSLNPYEIYRKNKKPEKAWKCWNLKGDNENPYVKGVMSMLSLYQWAVPRITFSGPTYYAGVL
jgi:hypothetical protein